MGVPKISSFNREKFAKENVQSRTTAKHQQEFTTRFFAVFFSYRGATSSLLKFAPKHEKKASGSYADLKVSLVLDINCNLSKVHEVLCVKFAADIPERYIL